MSNGVVVVKKYGNRRLYDTESSRYITLDDLANLIRSGKDVKVVDAKTKADLTKSVLLQIITEQEKQQDLIPISFLKKVIRHGNANLRDSMQRYLTVSMDAFLDAQKEFEQRYRAFAGNFVNPLMWMVPPGAQAQGGPYGMPPEAEMPMPPMEPPPPDLNPPPPPMTGMQPPPAPQTVPQQPPQESQPPADQPPPDARPAGAESPDSSTETQIQLLKEQMAQMQQLMEKLVK